MLRYLLVYILSKNDFNTSARFTNFLIFVSGGLFLSAALHRKDAPCSNRNKASLFAFYPCEKRARADFAPKSSVSFRSLCASLQASSVARNAPYTSVARLQQRSGSLSTCIWQPTGQSVTESSRQRIMWKHRNLNRPRGSPASRHVVITARIRL